METEHSLTDGLSDTVDSIHNQANELYWHSGETVDQLAARLGMSRNALYASVRPIPAGGECPTCHEPLVFTNRSARAAGRATCPSCETEVILETAEQGRVPTAEEVVAKMPVHPVPPPDAAGRLEQLKESLAAVEPERAALIGGAAALGVAVGAAAVKAVRRRS